LALIAANLATVMDWANVCPFQIRIGSEEYGVFGFKLPHFSEFGGVMSSSNGTSPTVKIILKQISL